MAEESERPRVLVVEDETSIREGLCDVLRMRGMEVTPAADGAQALDAVGRAAFDLVVLDVMMPEVDGFTVCKRLRAQGLIVAVLMLTAKGAEDDVLRGFEAGADDYVTKPFSVRELVARVQALLKRSGRLQSECFTVGPFRVDPGKSTASRDGEEFALTIREVRILRLLGQEAGRIVSRRRLLREAWDMNNADQVETRTVDVHIGKLRKKLGAQGQDLVQTVRGQGYRLCQG